MSSTSQNMIISDDVSRHSSCATEVERPKMNKVSTHVKKRENPEKIRVLIYKKSQRITFYMLIPKM